MDALERNNRLWIDLYEGSWNENDKIERTWIYELRIFGKEWISKAQSVYNSMNEHETN